MRETIDQGDFFQVKSDGRKLPKPVAIFGLVTLLSIGMMGNASSVGAKRPVIRISETKKVSAYSPYRNIEIEALKRYQKEKYRIPHDIALKQSKAIVSTADKHNLPVEVIVGIVEKESSFNRKSRSKVGAKGLMQIYKANSIKIDHNRAYDIHYNLHVGCVILKEKMERHNGNMRKSLKAYSGGSKKYPDRVYRNAQKYRDFRDQVVKTEVKRISENVKYQIVKI